MPNPICGIQRLHERAHVPTFTRSHPRIHLVPATTRDAGGKGGGGRFDKDHVRCSADSDEHV